MEVPLKFLPVILGGAEDECESLSNKVVWAVERVRSLERLSMLDVGGDG